VRTIGSWSEGRDAADRSNAGDRSHRLDAGTAATVGGATGHCDTDRHHRPLCADAIIVAIGTHVFPGTAGYGHFRFNDYAKLTVIGVVIGAAGWPVLTHVSSAPRWLYGWLTVLISVGLFLPDAWLLIRGQPLKEVAVLMFMHVAVAAVIYCSMVLIAPARGVRGRS